jgi:hypothetical protein
MRFLYHVTILLSGESLKYFDIFQVNHIRPMRTKIIRRWPRVQWVHSLILDMTDIHCPVPVPLHAASQIDMTSPLLYVRWRRQKCLIRKTEIKLRYGLLKYRLYRLLFIRKSVNNYKPVIHGKQQWRNQTNVRRNKPESIY